MDATLGGGEVTPDDRAAFRAEREHEHARDAISAGCATPDEWERVASAVSALRADIDTPYQPTVGYLTEWDRQYARLMWGITL